MNRPVGLSNIVDILENAFKRYTVITLHVQVEKQQQHCFNMWENKINFWGKKIQEKTTSQQLPITNLLNLVSPLFILILSQRLCSNTGKL